MRAFVLPEEGTGPVVADLPVPTPGPDEVLVRVLTSSVNPHDLAVADGAAARYLTYRFPVVLGSDLAGTVEDGGAGVVDLAPGQRVFGLVRELVAARGTFAEFVAVPRGWVEVVPDALDDVAAGALGLAALTALRCVDAAGVGAGDAVVVNGATGGVGSYVIQMLAARGVRVIATARPGREADHVTALGAADVVDWTAGELAGRARELLPDGADALVDLVLRDRAALTALADGVLAHSGRVVSTGHAADPARPGGTNVLAGVDREALRTLARLAGEGLVRAPVTRTFGFPDIGAALDAARAGAVGKLAVRVASTG